MAKRALVLGAGGHAASAWEIGLAAGMADSGVDLCNAELFVGTSGGARVAAQLASGTAIEKLFARYLEPAAARAPGIDLAKWRNEISRAKETGGAPAEILQRIGSLALAAQTESGSDRRRFIASELPVEVWPDIRVLLAVVEVETGERRVFERTSAIALIDAVTASGAVAGIWPAVPFQGRHYIDGGFYSMDNADLATDFDRVLILALRAGVPPLSVIPLEEGVRVLERSGSLVEVVHPDDATQAVFASFGGNLLDPAIRERTARAAREQGRRIANERIAAFWS